MGVVLLQRQKPRGCGLEDSAWAWCGFSTARAGLRTITLLLSNAPADRSRGFAASCTAQGCQKVQSPMQWKPSPGVLAWCPLQTYDGAIADHCRFCESAGANDLGLFGDLHDANERRGIG